MGKSPLTSTKDSGALQALVAAFGNERRVKAGAVIITVFGDVILPRGGAVWLGSLIQLLGPLGLNERLVRTAAFRLVADEWLVPTAEGRRTNYGLSDTGRRRAEEAARHIYSPSAPQWDGQWRLLTAPTDLPAGLKEALRRSLYWHGFGQLGANVFVHPSAEWRVVFDALTLEGFQHLLPGMLAFSALHPGAGLGGTNRDVVRTAWDLKQLGDDYDAFIKRYAPVADELTGPGGAAGVDPETAFQVRVLLIHDFRRLLLRDPQLPEALLPTHWPGLRARAMCQAIYRQLWPASESHLAGTLRLANGSELKVGAEVPANVASWLL